MPQDTFTTVIRGFDVMVDAGEDPDTYRVNVTEGGSVPWEVTVPVNLDDFDGENELLDGSNEILTYVSQAAVDLFEAQRDTLGEGAGALEATATKKRSYTDSMYREDWFMRLKNTPFEEEAAQLLSEYFALDLEEDVADTAWEEFYAQERKICYDLNMLNLERMQDTDVEEIVIVIQAQCSPRGHMRGDDISTFVERFVGHPLEGQVISKMKELLDLRERRDSVNNADTGPSVWDRRRELENRMQDLALTALQQNVMEVPETGMEAAPNMAGDLAQLMEGVDLHAPLAAGVKEVRGFAPGEPGRPSIPTPTVGPVGKGRMKLDQSSPDQQDAYPSKLSEADPIGESSDPHNPMGQPPQQDIPTDGGTIGDSVNVRIPPRKPTGAIKHAFEEIESAEDRVEELGHIRNDLDPALLEPDQFAFGTNERIELKKDVEGFIGWGLKKVFPKGTKGYAESQYDKHGDKYVMRMDDGHLLTVKWDDIKSIPK